MTVLAPALERLERVARRRQYLMCRPDHFAVTYAINPWMDPSRPVDRDVAVRQWEALRETYVRLGHSVDVIDAEPGLPDMVFAANGGLVVGGRALGARFAFPERAAEGPAYLRWLGREVAAGRLRRAVPAEHVNEGEGDFLVAGGLVLAGTLAATALALSEARPDLSTLGQVGARPRTRRAVAAGYALVLGVVGAVLGVLAGLIPGIAVSVPLTRGYATGGFSYGPLGDVPPDRDFVVDVPWLLVALVLVVLPLVSAAVAAAATRSRLDGPTRRIA